MSEGPSRGNTVLAVARFEAERRRLSTAVVAVVLAVFAALMLALGPQVLVEESFADLVDAMPPAVRAAFGFEHLDSLAGLLASEFYSLGWILLFGVYCAYAMAGTVAGDADDRQLDLALASPVSRSRLLAGKFLALLVPIAVVTAVVVATIAVGGQVIDEPISLPNLLALQAVAALYLLAVGAVGLLLSVTLPSGRTARRAAVGAVVGLWLFDSLLAGTGLEWLGAVTPTHHLDAPAILVEGTVSVPSVAYLVGATLLVLAVARHLFVAGDVG